MTGVLFGGKEQSQTNHEHADGSICGTFKLTSEQMNRQTDRQGKRHLRWHTMPASSAWTQSLSPQPEC